MRSTLKLELAHLFEVEAKRSRDPQEILLLRYQAADMRRKVKMHTMKVREAMNRVLETHGATLKKLSDRG